MPNLLSGASLSAILPHRIARLPPASAIRMQATRAACSATPGTRRATLCPHWTPLSPSLAQQHITAINHGHASFGPAAPVTAPRPSTGPSSLYKTPALLCPRGHQKSSTAAGSRASHAHDAQVRACRRGQEAPRHTNARPGQRTPGRPTPGSQARRLEHSASSALAVRP